MCEDPWTLVECGDAVAVEPRALEEPRVDEEPRHALRHPLRLLRQLRLQHLIKQTRGTVSRYRDRLKGDSHVNARNLGLAFQPSSLYRVTHVVGENLHFFTQYKFP